MNNPSFKRKKTMEGPLIERNYFFGKYEGMKGKGVQNVS